MDKVSRRQESYQCDSIQRIWDVFDRVKQPVSPDIAVEMARGDECMTMARHGPMLCVSMWKVIIGKLGPQLDLVKRAKRGPLDTRQENVGT